MATPDPKWSVIMLINRRKKILVALAAILAAGSVGLFVFYLILANSMTRTTYIAYLNTETAQLVTPTRTHPLDVKEITHSEGDYSLRNPLVVIGGPEEVNIVFSPLGPTLQILHRVESMHRRKPSIIVKNRVDVSFPEDESYYQLNSLKKVPFRVHVMEYDKPLPSSPRSVYFSSERPGALSGYRIGYSGGSLYPDAVEKIRETGSDVHKYHIRFLVGDQPHSIDISFRIGLKAGRIAGVPGVP